MNDTTKAAADAAALLYEIDDIARGYCEHEYGLPMGDIIAIAQMRAAIEAAIERARSDALEQAAKWVDARRDAYMQEHGTFDPFTGQLEFGRGVMGEIKIEHIGELSEIAEGIRALGTTGEHHD